MAGSITPTQKSPGCLSEVFRAAIPLFQQPEARVTKCLCCGGCCLVPEVVGQDWVHQELPPIKYSFDKMGSGQTVWILVVFDDPVELFKVYSILVYFHDDLQVTLPISPGLDVWKTKSPEASKAQL